MAPSQYGSFSPKEYLDEYYSETDWESEGGFLMRFYHGTYSACKPFKSFLELGGGPVLLPLISASQKAESIVFSDFLEENRFEIKKWLENSPEAFNWDEYFRLALQLENSELNDVNLGKIKQRVRSKVKQVIKCDIFSENPLTQVSGQFDCVSVNFCPEAVADNEADFLLAMKNIASLVSGGGKLVMALTRNTKFFLFGGQKFPAFPVDESYMKRLIGELGFRILDFRSTDVNYDDGYDGIMAITAEKLAPNH